MRILHVMRQAFDYTGIELHVYELSCEQLRLGHQVSVVAPIQGGDLRLRMLRAGLVVMQPAQALVEFKPELLHLHNAQVTPAEVTERVPTVATLHDAWDSVSRGKVRRWIVVRSDLERFVPSGAICIPNGFDLTRFYPRPLPETEMPRVLCIGNFRDKRRRAMLEDLLSQAERNEIALSLVGLGLARRVLRPGAAVFSMRWDIENLITLCTHTAGIYVGRTTIEGWLCSRPGWAYDENGRKDLLYPPGNTRDTYGIERVAQQVMSVYEQVLAGA